jgi:hypothetical protein
MAAARGLVGVTVDHPLHHPGSYPAAASDVDRGGRRHGFANFWVVR